MTIALGLVLFALAIAGLLSFIEAMDSAVLRRSILFLCATASTVATALWLLIRAGIL